MTGRAMDAVVARACSGLAALEEAAHELSVARVRVTDDAGLVSVEVDQYGGLCRLWIAESLDGTHADDLGRTVVETAARAAELLAQRGDLTLASLARRLSD